MCGNYEDFKSLKDLLKEQWDKALNKITHYHVHIYYDNDPFGRNRLNAEMVAGSVKELFPEGTEGPFPVGKVGPHTKNNIELSVEKKSFGDVLQYLQMNNHGLSILVHPRTGDELTDHGDAVVWIGKPVPFNEAFFAQIRAANDARGPKR